MPRSAAAAVAPPVVDWSAAVAERAYFKAERRGFAPGYELEDWLAAEREVTALLAAPPAAKPKRKTTRAKSGAEKAPAAETAAAKASAARTAAAKTPAAKSSAARPK